MFIYLFIIYSNIVYTRFCIAIQLITVFLCVHWNRHYFAEIEYYCAAVI